MDKHTRYNRSPKGLERLRRYDAKPESKLTKRAGQRLRYSRKISSGICAWSGCREGATVGTLCAEHARCKAERSADYRLFGTSSDSRRQ